MSKNKGKGYCAPAIKMKSSKVKKPSKGAKK